LAQILVKGSNANMSYLNDVEMRDLGVEVVDDDAEADNDAKDEEQMMYGHLPMTEDELNAKYPNRPHNIHKTLPFHDLYLELFNPLNENKKKPTGPVIARKKLGPHGSTTNPNEIRRHIIQRFIGGDKRSAMTFTLHSA
jgi:hypothetical protein